MPPFPLKRRRDADDAPAQRKKNRKVKKQKVYHSSSEDENEAPSSELQPSQKSTDGHAGPTQKPKSILKHTFADQYPSVALDGEQEGGDAVLDLEENDGNELENNTAWNTMPANDSSSDEDDVPLDDEPDIDAASPPDDNEASSDSDASLTSSQASLARRKRNDPEAFATSISKILDTKLSTSKRADPVLSRSKSAADANKSLADGKLEQRARAQIRSERRQALERGRVKDVLGLQDDGVDTGRVLEEENRLRKTAQRGVVKLFNAVRAAQVQAEAARKTAKDEGLIGTQKREERINEMSKQGFLDLISSGGRQAGSTT